MTFSPRLLLWSAAVAVCALAPMTAAQSGSASITLVTTVAELRDALDSGAQHIEITEHLDLTGEPPVPRPVNQELFWVKPSTQSIRVRPAIHVSSAALHVDMRKDIPS